MKRSGRPLLLLFALAGACVPSESDPPRADGGLKPQDAAVGADAGEATPDGGAAADAATPDGGVPPPPDAGPLPDQDRDGIPDAEDPEPRRVNPQLFADAFDQADSGWTFTSVSMAIDPQGSLLVVDAIEPFEREGWIGPRPTWADYVVRSRIRVDAVGTDDDARSGHAGVIARVSQVTPSRYVTCGIDLKRGRVVVAEHEGTDRRTLGETPSPAAAGAWLDLTLVVRGNGYTCRVGGVEAQGASPTFSSGAIGFRSYDATFAADYIEVYEILP